MDGRQIFLKPRFNSGAWILAIIAFQIDIHTGVYCPLTLRQHQAEKSARASRSLRLHSNREVPVSDGNVKSEVEMSRRTSPRLLQQQAFLIIWIMRLTAVKSQSSPGPTESALRLSLESASMSGFPFMTTAETTPSWQLWPLFVQRSNSQFLQHFWFHLQDWRM